MSHMEIPCCSACCKQPDPACSLSAGALTSQGTVWPELGIALVVLGCHLLGALVYATHWPQRHFPGMFDLGVSGDWGRRLKHRGQARRTGGATLSGRGSSACMQLVAIGHMLLTVLVGGCLTILCLPWFPSVQGFSHNLMHIFVFTAYNCAYPYLSHMYSQREVWWGMWGAR